MTRRWFLVAFLVLLLVSTASPTASVAQPVPGFDGPAVDSLGRRLPAAGEVRESQADRYVGIFYFLWLDLPSVLDNSKILAANPDAAKLATSPPWGKVHEYHFWGEPLFGYYRSHDPWVLRRHAYLLADAGVDFLVFDATNAATYDKVVDALCEEFERLRAAGENVPKITFMTNTAAGRTARHLYERLYKPGRHRELWFEWKGKPLLICDPEKVDDELKAFFTLRKAHWPFELVNTHNAWHWEAIYPQVYSYDTDPDKPEQVNVSVGQNLHQEDGRVEMMSTGHARGRSFHGGMMDRSKGAYRHGYNFQEQWKRAHELDPEIVFITGWNEWIAMRLGKMTHPPIFCDQYNTEFSRDVEMMRGGYGDNYYYQMVANIRRFKGMPPRKKTAAKKTIAIDGSFDQWKDVTHVYRDHVFETLPRDFPGCGNLHYSEKSGRNDLAAFKVAHDDVNVYFLAESRKPLTDPAGEHWMNLAIDVAGGGTFLVTRDTKNSAAFVIKQKTGDAWKQLATTPHKAKGNRLNLAVPKSALGITDDDFTLDFQWADNVSLVGPVQDRYSKGDVAPEGRFRYRYDGGGGTR